MEVTRDNLDEALNLLEAALGAGHMVAIDLEMTVGPPAAAACACAQSTRAQGIRTPDPKMAHSRGDTPEQRYRKMVHVVHRPLPATGGPHSAHPPRAQAQKYSIVQLGVSVFQWRDRRRGTGRGRAGAKAAWEASTFNFYAAPSGKKSVVLDPDTCSACAPPPHRRPAAAEAEARRVPRQEQA